MSKELKAPDKVTQKMTRDGAVAENLTTGETSSISERPQEENYSAPAGVAAEKVVQHIGAEIERHAAKGAEKKALDATQPKTHSSRLQFSEAERATPELQKAIKKSDKAADCLDAARAAIPKQTKIKKERVFDEAKGKAKTRLSFEKTDKPPNGKLRHNPLSRPAQELNSTVHGKIYEVEKENVGVESGHRVELAGEKAGGMAARAVKGGIRRHKLKPYRAAAAAEKQAVKANADFLYQKALHDNPALAHSNPISRFWQKQRIKKQYAKTLKAGGKAKKTAEATAKAAKKTAQETKRATFFVVRHWKGCLIVGGIAFIVLLLFGGLSSCSLFGGNSGSGLIASSYLSEDADITGAESAYAAMEAELQDMLDNIESEYPGYDEYRVNADEIEHDPYVLISILSAWHEGVFTLDEVQSTLEMLFEKQYILTVEEEVQVRYRTETRTDSEGNPYTVEVPYNYYILHVDLENFNLSHVPVYIMGEEQLSMYAMYMSSLGNRPDLFPQSGYVSKYYENPPADYEVPAALLGSDEKFARLMEEADKYVGFPYVWGGSTPETSFDCSGFVSYVLTNSGLYNTGRLGAQGLYNISTPVSNPQPGDLVFFTGTYDTPGVSHVGIYVGEDGDGSPVMLHCGDPIQYSKLDTSYWQSHDGAVLRDVTVMVIVHTHAGDNGQGHIFQEPQLQGAGGHHDLHCHLVGFLIQQGGFLAEQVLAPVVEGPFLPALGDVGIHRCGIVADHLQQTVNVQAFHQLGGLVLGVAAFLHRLLKQIVKGFFQCFISVHT